MSAVAANVTAVSTGAYTFFGAITSVVTNGTQIAQGWMQVELKKADGEAQIPGLVTIPPVIGAR